MNIFAFVRWLRFPALLCGVSLFLGVAAVGHYPAAASSALVRTAGFDMNIGVTSLKAMRWRGVIPQERDFSCGAASIATLLTYHYGRETPEIEVFRDMFAHGDQEQIMQKGFSLLDMKTYLATIGYNADGFRISLDKLMNTGVPAIVLIDLRGYRHFVVIKGVTPDEVLIGDPARGIKRYSREKFKALMVSDVVFVIRNDVKTARSNFNLVAEWGAIPKAPVGKAVDNLGLASVTILLPTPGTF